MFCRPATAASSAARSSACPTASSVAPGVGCYCHNVCNIQGTCGTLCKPNGSTCMVDTDCCDAPCVGGICGGGSCQPDEAVCTNPATCCSLTCSFGDGGNVGTCIPSVCLMERLHVLADHALLQRLQQPSRSAGRASASPRARSAQSPPTAAPETLATATPARRRACPTALSATTPHSAAPRSARGATAASAPAACSPASRTARSAPTPRCAAPSSAREETTAASPSAARPCARPTAAPAWRSPTAAPAPAPTAPATPPASPTAPVHDRSQLLRRRVQQRLCGPPTCPSTAPPARTASPPTAAPRPCVPQRPDLRAEVECIFACTEQGNVPLPPASRSAAARPDVIRLPSARPTPAAGGSASNPGACLPC